MKWAVGSYNTVADVACEPCRNVRIKGDPVQAAPFADPILAWFFCFVEPRKALGANWDRTRMSKWANWEESWSAVPLLPPLLFPSVQHSLFYSTSGNPQMNHSHLLRQPQCTSSSLFRICSDAQLLFLLLDLNSYQVFYYDMNLQTFSFFFPMLLHIVLDKSQ